MYDVLIIGKGPAGISAALYTVRAGLGTLVVASGESELVKSARVENYYGFEHPVSGKQLLDAGVAQAARLGVELMQGEVVSVSPENKGFRVDTTSTCYIAASVLLAPGQPAKKVSIANLASFEGRGVSYCTTCDGFFYRGKKVGILGNRDYAIHEAEELMGFTSDITLYTNGLMLELTDTYSKKAENLRTDKRKISKVDGEEQLNRIYFEDGSSEVIDGLFVASGSASGSDLAKKMGLATEDGSIVVGPGQITNIPGIFAAGDCTGGFRQISTAVGEGALAGRSIIDYVRGKKHTGG